MDRSLAPRARARFAPVALLTLLLVSLLGSPARAAVQGYLDGVDTSIHGWAYDSAQPNTAISVDLYDGTKLLATVSAGTFRQDLKNAGFGNGNHAFSLATPAGLQDGLVHSVSARFSGTTTNLSTSPKSYQSGPPAARTRRARAWPCPRPTSSPSPPAASSAP